MLLRRGAAAGRLQPPAPPAPAPPAGHAGGDPLLAAAVARLDTISKIEEVQSLVPAATVEMGGPRRANTFLRSGSKARKLADLLDKAPLRLQAPWQQSLIAIIDRRYPVNDPAWPAGTTEAEKAEVTRYVGGFYPQGDGMCGCAEFPTRCPLCDANNHGHAHALGWLRTPMTANVTNRRKVVTYLRAKKASEHAGNAQPRPPALDKPEHQCHVGTLYCSLGNGGSCPECLRDGPQLVPSRLDPAAQECACKTCACHCRSTFKCGGDAWRNAYTDALKAKQAAHLDRQGAAGAPAGGLVGNGAAAGMQIGGALMALAARGGAAGKAAAAAMLPTADGLLEPAQNVAEMRGIYPSGGGRQHRAAAPQPQPAAATAAAAAAVDAERAMRAEAAERRNPPPQPTNGLGVGSGGGKSGRVSAEHPVADYGDVVTMVPCPICCGQFPESQVEAHADACSSELSASPATADAMSRQAEACPIEGCQARRLADASDAQWAAHVESHFEPASTAAPAARSRSTAAPRATAPAMPDDATQPCPVCLLRVVSGEIGQHVEACLVRVGATVPAPALAFVPLPPATTPAAQTGEWQLKTVKRVIAAVSSGTRGDGTLPKRMRQLAAYNDTAIGNVLAQDENAAALNGTLSPEEAERMFFELAEMAEISR